MPDAEATGGAAAPPPDAMPAAGAPKRADAVFTRGSTMGHVARMTLTASVGLIAIFAVDFLSLLYVSWLRSETLTAAVGFASVLLFLMTSANIGFMIAATALTARKLGQGDRAAARRVAGSAIAWMAVFAVAVSAVAMPLLGPILALLGAEGAVAEAARIFLLITVPSNLLMAFGMGYSGILRAVGDANRAMYVTLAAGFVTAIVDPILIFGLGLGLPGAAIGVVISRVIFAAVGWHGAVKVHAMVERPTLAAMGADAKPVMDVAGPAILTNIATPLANAVVARIVSDFGAWAVAANAVIDRIIPLAFGVIFALSGAVGPILAQNWGAGSFDRMRATLRDSFLFVGLYVVLSWGLLVLFRQQIVDLFHLTGPAAAGVIFFCWISGPMWFFIGLLFTANAAFNNLGFPLTSTYLSWGRATIGTVPFAYVGARLHGYEGALAGVALGSVLFGVVAAALAWRVVDRLERRAGEAPVAPAPARA